jgi:tRNA nucleotidyltransferase (CCA-adding enzyme)
MVKKRTARDIMAAPVITVKEDMLVTDAMALMARSGISGMPVVGDDGRIVGMVTGRLLMITAVSGNAARTRVSEAMSSQMDIYGPVYAPTAPVEEIVNHFATTRINRVLVVEDGKAVGIICRLEIIRELDQIYGRFVVRD